MALGNYLILLAILLVFALLCLAVHAVRYYRRVRREDQEEAEEALVVTIVFTPLSGRRNPLIQQYSEVPEQYRLMEEVSHTYLENVYRITHGGK